MIWKDGEKDRQGLDESLQFGARWDHKWSIGKVNEEEEVNWRVTEQTELLELDE